MKKILTILLSISMLFCAVSCADGNVDNPPTTTATQDTEATTAAQTTSSPIELPPDVEPEVPFYAGYAKVDITPDRFPVDMFGSNPAVKAMDNIYATVVAVSDGETKALFITLDLQNSSGIVLTRALSTAERYGVSKENVLVNVTHNHSGVHNSSFTTYEGRRWIHKYCDAIEEGIETALNDLSPATAEIGSTETPALNHVRRYYMKDGTTHGICMPSNKAEYDRHESEADRELLAIRFNREDKKDIVMVNWQAHAAHAVGFITDAITADFIYTFRNGVEEKYDLLFAYYQGACGNINFTSNIHGSVNYLNVGIRLVDSLGEALESAEPSKLGKITAKRLEYTATVDHSTDKYYDKAIEARNALNAYKAENNNNEMSNDQLYKLFGFYSKYHVSSIITRYTSDKTIDIPISAISFGDISFASTPYEMFDTNGMQVKDGSPFKMTFMCAYTNGSYGYVPSANVYGNGGYEVYTTRFIKGTGDNVATKLVEMLNEQYNTETH